MSPIGPVELFEVQQVLAPRLRDLPMPPPRRRYGHVFVGSTDAARGMTFDVVFVPGLAEKLFPRKVIEDPMLLDAERRSVEAAELANSTRSGDRRAAGLEIGSGSRFEARVSVLSANRRSAIAPARAVVLRTGSAARGRRRAARLRRAWNARGIRRERKARLARARACERCD